VNEDSRSSGPSRGCGFGATGPELDLNGRTERNQGRSGRRDGFEAQVARAPGLEEEPLRSMRTEPWPSTVPLHLPPLESVAATLEPFK
jgi:hypothetical protein